MKTFGRAGVLASLVFVGAICVSGQSQALAAQSQPPNVRIVSPAPASPAIAADYFWHGRHYAYFWHGRYFNHRVWRNKTWYYYG